MKKISSSLLVSALLSGCSPCDYEKLSKLPDEASFPAKYREEISLIKEVRRFGIEHLGLYECTKQYTSFSPTEGEAKPLYHLSVTKPLVLPLSSDKLSENVETISIIREDLEAKHFWSFVDDLQDELKYYKKEGYDTFFRSTTNYNDLGSEGGSAITPQFISSSKTWLASVVLHEICHDGVEEWIGAGFPSELNESYCNVIGMAGAVKFFEQKKGTASAEYKEALRTFERYKEGSSKFNYVYEKLRSLYGNQGLSREQKLEQRQALFADAAPHFSVEVNNAVLWESYAYRRYFPLMVRLYDSYGEDLPSIINEMKQCPENKEEALKYIWRLVDIH